MPKLVGMAQLSRPFQIALVAFAMLVLAWFFVLHRSGSSSTGSSSPSVSASSGSSSGSSSAGGSSSVYHGSAPGVEGLTRDVQRAHGAVAATKQNAQEVQSKAAQAPGAAVGGGTAAVGASQGAAHASRGTASASASATSSHARTHASTAGAASSTSKAAVSRHPASTGHGSRATTSSGSAPGRSEIGQQAAVTSELKQGKVVLLLFWNPHSYDDTAVAVEVLLAAHALGHSIAVHVALAKQVNSFGSITRNIQVYQTPTLLIVNPKLQVTTLTGLIDAYTIKQAVAEARR